MLLVARIFAFFDDPFVWTFLERLELEFLALLSFLFGTFVQHTREFHILQILLLLRPGLRQLHAELGGINSCFVRFAKKHFRKDHQEPRPLLTDLFRQHTPFEFGQVFHRPNIVPPSCALLSPNGLRIQHVSNPARHFLIFEFDPSFREVRFFRRCIFTS